MTAEFTKGELEYSVLDGTNTPATLFIEPDDDGIDVDIAVFEKWEQKWAKKEMIANAEELVRRWNEYSDLKQQRDDLLAACEIGLMKALAISTVATELGAEITPTHKKHIEIIEAAIKKAR